MANPWGRRSAKRTGELWLQRLKESTPHKKLNLIYLANGENKYLVSFPDFFSSSNRMCS